MMDDLLSARPGGGVSFGMDTSPPPSSDKGVNFTMFLTMMGEHLFEFDAESDLIEAFECFDEDDSGVVKGEDVRKWLKDVGERMSDDEIDRLLKGPFTDRQGNFNYREWVKVLRLNADEDKNADAAS